MSDAPSASPSTVAGVSLFALYRHPELLDAIRRWTQPYVAAAKAERLAIGAMTMGGYREQPLRPRIIGDGR